MMTVAPTDKPVKKVIFLDIDGMSLIEKIDKNPAHALRHAKSTYREDLLLQSLHEAQENGYDIAFLTARPESAENMIERLENTIGTKSTNTIKENFAKKGITISAIARAPEGLKGSKMAEYMEKNGYTKGLLIDDQLKQVNDVKKVKKEKTHLNMHAYDINSLSHLTKLRSEIHEKKSLQSPFMSEKELEQLRKKDPVFATSLQELQNFVEKPIICDEKSPTALQELAKLEQRVAMLTLWQNTNPEINLKNTSSKKENTLVSYCDQLVKDLKWQYHQANKAGYEPDLKWIQKVSSNLTNVLQKHQHGLLEARDVHGLFKATTERNLSISEKIQSISVVNKICHFFNIGKGFRAKYEAKEVDKSWKKIQNNESKKTNSKSEVNLLKVTTLLSQPVLKKAKSMPNLKKDELTSATAKGYKKQPENHRDASSINPYSYRGGKI